MNEGDTEPSAQAFMTLTHLWFSGWWWGLERTLKVKLLLSTSLTLQNCIITLVKASVLSQSTQLLTLISWQVWRQCPHNLKWKHLGNIPFDIMRIPSQADCFRSPPLAKCAHLVPSFCKAPVQNVFSLCISIAKTIGSLLIAKSWTAKLKAYWKKKKRITPTYCPIQVRCCERAAFHQDSSWTQFQGAACKVVDILWERELFPGNRMTKGRVYRSA